ncbi:MAG TPA: succinate-semialdehyde dehydrogenase (NADP(+)) [Phycisphaerales bacterium]|nr:succinate-semialdehyde dehydrogenase (NADP(+)) [Phycisphaerales bacterium]
MQTRNLIDGRWVGAISGREFTVRDPATDAQIARVPDGGPADARAAIEGAARAFPAWSALPAPDRARIVRRWGDLLVREQERLARLMTSEQGKPLGEARGEIAYAASFLEWAAEEARRAYGRTIPASTPDKRILVLKQPVGVTCAITPWNFPSAMITRKAGPALAVGCTMVVKPAEQTPLSALALAELALEAGVPPGVLSVVTGDAPAIGAEFLSNPLVRKLSFTGSTEVGKLLVRASAQNLTRLSLELGGHAPFIVFEDADLDAAVAGALSNKFRNGGQTCICANRFFVHESLREEFVERLARGARALRVGPGTDEGVHIGPMIDDHAVAKIERHLSDALAKGARLVCGGARSRPRAGLADRFFAPTVLDRCTPEMLCCTEETFGPVAPVQSFTDEADVVRRANDSPFGLAAYFYTRDASRLIRVAEALDYGIVGASDALPSTAQAPFGGMKQSGLGREGGREGIEAFLETKYVSWRVG